ncbi:unnamed protein product [Chironomus riparius]|uniref:Uncharacterized protein n=1 Tax=Chironomus riparius TaxID=315576 RepID=A0A9N9RTW1_9DIPT|nr:unnamed protein product [Chironomus riparius]
MANSDCSSEAVVTNRRVPKSVCLVLFSKFLERFCATGISAILVVYLHTKLEFDQSSSTAIYHLNELFTFFCPLFGAILAESYCGLFKAIVTMCFVAFVGGLVVTLSTIGSISLIKILSTLIGLVLVYASLGSMRSNLVAFGADQYVLPGEAKGLELYFPLQMLCIKFGSLLGRIVAPILREDVKCFGDDSCYFMAFGTPTLTILLAFIIMIFGKSAFIHIHYSENMFMKMINSITYALKKSNQIEVKSHWLDYAENKYGEDHVKATKLVLENLVIFLPTAFYWAVFAQQGSRWIFQAMQMNGDIGIFTIKPDQMIALNSIFSIISLPICNFILFPIIAKLGYGCLLQRIAIGGFLCCFSFILAAIVEVNIYEEEKISILWLIPQFAVLAISENFVYISLIDFAYSKTPHGMKSVMTAIVFLLIAIGNLFITFVSSAKFFSTQFYEFLFYAGLLFVDMIIFIGLSKRYMRRKSRRMSDVEM